MKVSKNKLILTVGLVTLGFGGWASYEYLNKPDEASIDVVDATSLPSDIEVIDESNRPDAMVEVYRNLVELENVDKHQDMKRVDIEDTLVKDTMILNYPFPIALENKKEPEMTMLVQKLLSRMDGATNELEDASQQVIDKKTFHKWESLFNQWTGKEIEQKELVKEWEEILKTVPESLLTEPTVMTIDFPYSASAVEMMDTVLNEIQEKGGSTAPHICFTYVEFNEKEALYTLYYAESHIR